MTDIEEIRERLGELCPECKRYHVGWVSGPPCKLDTRTDEERRRSAFRARKRR